MNVKIKILEAGNGLADVERGEGECLVAVGLAIEGWSAGSELELARQLREQLWEQAGDVALLGARLLVSPFPVGAVHRGELFIRTRECDPLDALACWADDLLSQHAVS
jgi:hypothetical protein